MSTKDLNMPLTVEVKLEALSFCRSCFNPLEVSKFEDYEDILTKLQEILQFPLPAVPEAPGFCELCTSNILGCHDFKKQISEKQTKFMETGIVQQSLDPLEQVIIKSENLSTDVITYDKPVEQEPSQENGSQLTHESEAQLTQSIDFCLNKPKRRRAPNKKKTQPEPITVFCDLCGYKSTNRANIYAHFKNFHVPKNYACPRANCSYRSKKLGTMKSHVENVHDRDRSIKKPGIACPECGKLLATEAILKNHVNRIHRKIKKVFCKDCEKWFYNNTDLRLHRNFSHGPEKVVCDVCGKYYPSELSLKSHKLSHEAVQEKFACHCGKIFPLKKSLEGHVERVHLNIKKFNCKQCEMRFCKKTELRLHIMTMHKGIRFQCPVSGCSSVNNRKTATVAHLRKRHNLTAEEMEECMKKLNEYNRSVKILAVTE